MNEQNQKCSLVTAGLQFRSAASKAILIDISITRLCN